jgi:3-hydroxyisobutyrate dehydrogenase-like beta-hydroxyacid dehydrogenase
MKIGFVGLGQMGRHMAANMLKSGAELIVNDIRADVLPFFEKQGAKASTVLKDVAAADIIFLSLPEGEAVKGVILGENGLLNDLKEGQIVVDTSTIKYSDTLDIYREMLERGIEFLDAPVSGMESRAKDGTLTVMCGGGEGTFKKVEPYLKFIANKILYMGRSGSGQLTKLINQLLFDMNVASLAEILPMSVKMGLDPYMVGEVVNSGTGKSYASDFFIPRILKNEFTEGYALKSAYKDLVSAAEISANLHVPLPVLGAATSTYQMALLKGYGDQNKGAMIRVFEELLGVEYRKK